MKSFTYISLGCKVNSYESNALADLLKKEGYVYSEDNPDIAFINTCSVTSTADQKSRQHIRKLINRYPNVVVVVMGCHSQGQHNFIKQEIKPAIIVGTSNRDKIIDLIKEYEINKTPIDLTEDNARLFKRYEELGVTSYSEQARAYLKIEDGCDNFCSYCLIPYRRGKARSRDYNVVMEEAKSLVMNNYQEIVLTGIHIGWYGKDLIDMSFSKLTRDLLDIPNLHRLRISSIEESEIDDKLISLINERDNLANHFHIPLQSGSETVLKRMNRKYTKEQFLTKLKLIRKACPEVALTTDVIVGFPGESEEEFLETIEFIKECDFNMLHVFPYSAREGTVAAKMSGQIDPKIKKERCLRLIELSNQLWDKYTSKFVGREVEVLIEQYDAKNHMNIGHTTNYLEVKIPGDKIPVGSLISVVYKK